MVTEGTAAGNLAIVLKQLQTINCRNWVEIAGKQKYLVQISSNGIALLLILIWLLFKLLVNVHDSRIVDFFLKLNQHQYQSISQMSNATFLFHAAGSLVHWFKFRAVKEND